METCIDTGWYEVKTKVYLAGPMRNIPYFNFPAFFKAAQELRAQGYEVFNPAENDVANHGESAYINNHKGSLKQAVKESGFNLRQALKDDTEFICLHADAIAMLPGWEKSKGATAERALAEALDLRIIYL